MSDKGLISKMYKRTNTSQHFKNLIIIKLAEVLNRRFTKEDIQIVNWHMVSCSTSLITREVQIKTTVNYPFIPVRMAVITKTTKNEFCQGCEPKGILVHC